MPFSTHYDVYIDAWAGSVEADGIEVNLALIDGEMKIVCFNDNGDFNLYPLRTFLSEIESACSQIRASAQKSAD